MAAADISLQNEAVLNAALTGLTARGQKSLPPWLFYDEAGSLLFEQITALPEYYLTRTEREVFVTHADEIVTALGADVTLAELGAGSAAKTGVLLRAATKFQDEVLYQPIDISPSALDEAAASIAERIPGVKVEPQVANYITERYDIARPKGQKVLALYIGSSIGNFSPSEAVQILSNLRQHLQVGDALLLGTDLSPSVEKSVDTLLAAYDDAAGVTAAFNLNVLARLNCELGADFDVAAFAHRARWNQGCSRIEMHLESLIAQTVHIAGETISFAAGETIHTENSHKFTEASLQQLLGSADFSASRTFLSPTKSFAVTLAVAV
ncbi:L-histidine N(alpha)-methyltransferase [Granulicella paludicola]|uniref:L-histidine N(alpha)-methyltransferase n=1 Tax=Granulicella paludicola TaxID=474951 RepID=UPI0021DFC9B7|nr:L-histidine N(alpha)-methyltransferase [Granulicella paludicola]